MGFTEAISSGISKYATFSGRASRSEYWYWTLFAIIVAIVTVVIDIMIFPDMGIRPVNTIASLGLLLPGIAVSERRLHDLNRPGWWFLIAFTVLGLILLLVWDSTKGTTEPNQTGPVPIPGG